jgi:hypothetical protein
LSYNCPSKSTKDHL